MSIHYDTCKNTWTRSLLNGWNIAVTVRKWCSVVFRASANETGWLSRMQKTSFELDPKVLSYPANSVALASLLFQSIQLFFKVESHGRQLRIRLALLDLKNMDRSQSKLFCVLYHLTKETLVYLTKSLNFRYKVSQAKNKTTFPTLFSYFYLFTLP